ncbi:MAG: 30S ribosomal protein S6 [Dehalococcoidales bacterium]|nr:30S ribosomal protein S6 [Dehalococcoidales bacterium]
MATTNKEAVKIEAQKLNNYELVFIVKPDVTEEALDVLIGNISQFITSKGGTVASNDKWGKKKLAFPLKHSLEGSYILSKFNMDPAWSHELENSLFINDQVLRHLLVKVE